MKILLVSIACPPKSDPESIQVGRYLKYLIRNDSTLDIITSANPTLYMETDEHHLDFLEGVSNIAYVKLIENRYLNYLLRKIYPSFLQYPDPKWSFRFGKIDQLNKPDLIYSRSYPVSSTLMGLRLKKKWGVPWILHLSDPWALAYHGNSPATNYSARPRKWNQRKEHECFQLADRISFTSTKTMELYKAAYPQFERKFMISYNVFDKEYMNRSNVEFSQGLNIVYTGGFGEKRNPNFYLQAIEKFLMQNESVRGRINFIFTGPITRENKSKFEQFNHIPEIKHMGMISYPDMISYQYNSHILVNIDSDISDPVHSVFFPSKLLEYFAANRRILAICNNHSVTYSIVSNGFGDCVEFDDESQLIMLFSKYWEKFTSKDSAYFLPKNSADDYDANLNAQKLLTEMKNLIK